MKVMVIAAHPDDELLGVGGSVARHVAGGDIVSSLIVSEGATSRYAAGADQTLRDSARRANEELGVARLDFLDLPDQRLDTVPLIELTQSIEARIAEIKPNLVYTHHWGDLNRDHRLVFEAVLVACRPVGNDFPRQLLCFETPSSSEWAGPDLAMQFAPNHFVDVSATIEQKLRAMAWYASELRPAPHPRSIESLRSRAAYWGQIVGRSYAEPFALVRQVV